MTSVSKIVYASGVEIEVGTKRLNTGEFIQLNIKYEQPENKYIMDTLIVTLNSDEAKELIQAIAKVVP